MDCERVNVNPSPGCKMRIRIQTFHARFTLYDQTSRRDEVNGFLPRQLRGKLARTEILHARPRNHERTFLVFVAMVLLLIHISLLLVMLVPNDRVTHMVAPLFRRYS